MDGDSLWLIAIFAVFVVAGAYFACAESCFSAVNKIKIKTLADNGDRRAKKAMKIIDDFDRALTALLIGNNITHIAAASIATIYFIHIWGDSDNVTLICTFVTTGIVFLFSEMIPKSLANDRSETMALFCSGSLIVIMKILTPFVAFFSTVSNLFAKLFKTKEEPSITEDELYEIIENAEEQGVVDEEQSDLLKSVLDFDETKAEDVMTMRDDIAYLDISLSNKEIVDKLKTIPHSRIPMVDGTLDNVIGILPIRKFLKEYIVNKRVDVRSVLLKPHFVDTKESIDALLNNMRQHKIYLGIVKDESGKVCGVVTIEDFLEELVGEIWDEEDVVDHDFFKLGGNRFSVNTRLNVGEVFERMGLEAPKGRLANLALSVWVSEEFGRLPEEEESFIYENIELTVEKVSKTRVVTVVMRIMDEEDMAELNAVSDTSEETEAEKQ